MQRHTFNLFFMPGQCGRVIFPDAEHRLRTGEMPRQQREEPGTGCDVQLAGIIAVYDKAVRYGPADAKTMLGNILEEGHRFLKIKTRIRREVTMEENQW